MSFGWLVVYLFIFKNFAETAARETLEQVMAEALMKSGSNRFAVRAVCLAVSGVNHPTDQESILNWLRFDSIPLLQVKQSSGIWMNFLPLDFFYCFLSIFDLSEQVSGIYEG